MCLKKKCGTDENYACMCAQVHVTRVHITVYLYVCVHMGAGGRTGVDDGLIFLILQTAEE